MVSVERIVSEIKVLKNPYPKDVFLWDNEELCDFTRGSFNRFIFELVESTKSDVIRVIEELELEELGEKNDGIERKI